MKPFDKYFYYTQAVQSPREDVLFMRRAYRRIYGKAPVSFREDFCGAFALGTEWIKLSPKHRAAVADRSAEPLTYGKTHNLLNPEEKKRLRVFQENALSGKLPGADIISVSNFSHFIFKERETMLRYFKNVRKKLRPDGLFVQDAFGGSEASKNTEEKTNCGNFIYYWEQSRFNPIDNSARFAIHFKRRGEKKRRNVFVYDWRLWSLPEITDLLKEAGFSKTYVYWEDVDKDGEGTGRFRKKKRGDDCDVWIAYIISLP